MEDQSLTTSCPSASCTHYALMSHHHLILGSLLLKSHIRQDITYERRKDDEIMWKQVEKYEFTALQFRDSTVCDEIWKIICEVCV